MVISFIELIPVIIKEGLRVVELEDHTFKSYNSKVAHVTFSYPRDVQKSMHAYILMETNSRIE